MPHERPAIVHIPGEFTKIGSRLLQVSFRRQTPFDAVLSRSSNSEPKETQQQTPQQQQHDGCVDLTLRANLPDAITALVMCQHMDLHATANDLKKRLNGLAFARFWSWENLCGRPAINEMGVSSFPARASKLYLY